VEEQDLEEVEDEYIFTTFKNMDTFQETFHNHPRHACIVAQHTIRKKIV
jgi:hypothetical protein